MIARFFQPFDYVRGQAILAPPVRSDQATVDDQIRIATNGRCEMRVIPQGKAKVAKVLRRRLGLGHGPQGGHIDQLCLVGAFGLF